MMRPDRERAEGFIRKHSTSSDEAAIHALVCLLARTRDEEREVASRLLKLDARNHSKKSGARIEELALMIRCGLFGPRTTHAKHTEGK